MEENSMAKERLVEKIKNYVEAHRAEELSLDKIAAELNYSKFYMERVFAKITGMTIYKYIQACRLDAAAEQLARTNRPIIDIALEAGYNSPQAFTQAFRRIYLCPPRVYRKNGAYCPEKVEMFWRRGKNVRMGKYRTRMHLLCFFTVGQENVITDQYGETCPDCPSAFSFQEGRWAA